VLAVSSTGGMPAKNGILMGAPLAPATEPKPAAAKEGQPWGDFNK
jgi:hypothetical protein